MSQLEPLPATATQDEKVKWFSAHMRSLIEEAVAGDGADNTLDETAESMIDTISRNCAQGQGSGAEATDTPLSSLEISLHDLWYCCIQAAKAWGPENPKQDVLVRIILATRERGELVRRYGGEPVRLSGGRIWCDLPFLVEDLLRAFTDGFGAMSADQLASLASFIGRLVAVGVGGDALAASALVLLRQALEIEQPLASMGGLLGPLAQLLRFTAPKLIILSTHLTAAAVPEAVGADVNTPGQLAAGVGLISSGFSPDRWKFWTGRLAGLCKCGDETVVPDAKAALSMMWGEENNTFGPLWHDGSLTDREDELGLTEGPEGERPDYGEKS